jgi:group I intron endonuclease
MFIYQITNIITKKTLIGLTSQSPSKRWNQHLNLLKNNKHKNPHIQNSFNKYGQSAFTFKIIDTAKSKQELSMLEKFWISSTFSTDMSFGYNKKDGGFDKFEVSKESRKRMSDFQKQYFATPEGKARLTAMAEKKKGHTPWNKGTKGLVVAWNKGMARTEQEKIHHSKVMQGKKYPNRKKHITPPGNVKSVLCHQNGKTYISSTEAAKDLGLASRNIRQVAQGKKKTHKGYTFMFVQGNRG